MLTLPTRTISNTFDDVARHVDLEEDRLIAEKPIQEAFMIENKSQGAQGSRRNKGKGKGPQQGNEGNETSYSRQKCKHGIRNNMKSKNKNCFNCGKPGHFASDYIEPKVMFDHNCPTNIFVAVVNAC